MKVLIGSTFPLSLIRRKVVIEPISLAHFLTLIQQSEIHSFWGHENTIDVIKDILSIDLTPLVSRPALLLSEDNLPVLNDIEFTECWIISPEYIKGFRPEIGSEVTVDKISGWEVLKIEWVV